MREMLRPNQEIRIYLKDNSIRCKELAEHMNINQCRLSFILNTDLPKDHIYIQRMFKAANEIIENRKNENKKYK